jgi:hypothetical protein
VYCNNSCINNIILNCNRGPPSIVISIFVRCTFLLAVPAYKIRRHIAQDIPRDSRDPKAGTPPKLLAHEATHGASRRARGRDCTAGTVGHVSVVPLPGSRAPHMPLDAVPVAAGRRSLPSLLLPPLLSLPCWSIPRRPRVSRLTPSCMAGRVSRAGVATKRGKSRRQSF